MSAPYLPTISSGSTVFPRDFGHLVPVEEHHTLGYQVLERLIHTDQPRSRMTMVKNLAYIRCITACSTPPITGPRTPVVHLRLIPAYRGSLATCI